MNGTEPPPVRPWQDDGVALEAWKHYASVGGADKDRMVAVSTWLLGFSATIIGFTLTQGVDGYSLKQPMVSALLALVGMGLSAVALAVAFSYGGYANRAWATADQIAAAYNWHYLLPSNNPFQSASAPAETQGITWRRRILDWAHGKMAELALGLADPRPTQRRLAPVFEVFVLVALASFVIHLLVVLWSILLNGSRHLPTSLAPSAC
jgi:hypothetical protein